MISFNPINFKSLNVNVSPPTFKGLKLNNPVSDTFTFTGAVKNSDNAESELMKFAREYNLVEKAPKILCNEENLLGKGYSHSVYKIPDCDDYVLRIASSRNPGDFSKESIKLTEVEDNLDVNIGQVVGFIHGDDNFLGVIQILKKQAGTPIGNPPSEIIFIEDTDILRPGEEIYESKNRKNKYAKSLKELADLPVESYEKLIKDLQKASDKGYYFDYLNSNNLLVDSKNKSINLIDMEQKNIKPNYLDLLYALTNECYRNTFFSNCGEKVSDEELNVAFKNLQNIITKYLEAMKNTGAKFDFDNISYQANPLIDSLPMSYVCKTFDRYEKMKCLREMTE